MIARLPQSQREALERQDARYLQAPLENNPHGTAAHLRHMVRLLRQRRGSPCSEAMAHLAVLFQRTLDTNMPVTDRQSIACRKGCAHCCDQLVLVTALEAFWLAARLRERGGIQAMLDNAAGGIAAALREDRNPNRRCTLIADGACSVYDSRPLACRAYVSLDVNDCIAHFVLMGPSRARMPIAYGASINSARMLMFAALLLIGKKPELFELNAAVARILSLENAEGSWLRGEDIFAGIPTLPGPNAEFLQQIAALTGQIAHTL